MPLGDQRNFEASEEHYAAHSVCQTSLAELAILPSFPRSCALEAIPKPEFWHSEC